MRRYLNHPLINRFKYTNKNISLYVLICTPVTVLVEGPFEGGLWISKCSSEKHNVTQLMMKT